MGVCGLQPEARGGLRLCGAPGWNLERGRFYKYKTVVNREKINEQTEVFVLLKQKNLEQKNKSPFFAGDLK